MYPKVKYILKTSDNINDVTGSLVHSTCKGQYCPENCVKEAWKYEHDSGWQTDNTLRVECGKHIMHIIVEKAKQ